MKIGIDARLYRESGIGRYIRNLLTHLQKLDKENEYFIFLLEKDYQTLNFQKNFTKVKADFRWYTLAEQIKFPRLLHQYKLDLVHFPHFNVPILYKGKFIVTIHDLIHHRVSMKRGTTHSPLIFQLKQIGYKKIFKTALEKSKKIITVSEFVKKDITEHYNINEKKIIVTPEAVEKSFIELAKRTDKKTEESVLKKFNINGPYLFYVGNAHPHKNVEGLIKAFLKLKNDFKDLKLVLAGHDHYFWERLKNEYKHKDIVYTGFISDLELIVLYKNAQLFVTASLEEGFGIPILESFAMNTPVACSNRTSLPEVGGDAAVYFDPTNIDDMQSKITQVLTDKDLRKSLIEKGKKRVGLFNWRTLAQQTLKAYTLNP